MQQATSRSGGEAGGAAVGASGGSDEHNIAVQFVVFTTQELVESCALALVPNCLLSGGAAAAGEERYGQLDSGSVDPIDWVRRNVVELELQQQHAATSPSTPVTGAFPYNP